MKNTLQSICFLCCFLCLTYCQRTESILSHKDNDCPAGKAYFEVIFTTMEDTEKCSFELIDTVSQEVIQYVEYFSSKQTRFSYCRVMRKYELILKKSDKSGWKSNFVKVVLIDGTTLLRESLPDGSLLKRYPFNLEYLIQPKVTSWRYHISEECPSVKWNTVDGYQWLWPDGVSGSIPPAIGTTQYYSILFNVDNIDDYSLIRLSIVLYAGAIIYLNGYEITRINMPSGQIKHTDKAYVSLNNPIWYTVSENIQRGNIAVGMNVMGVELHMFDQLEKINSFDGSALLIINDSFQLMQGIGFTYPTNEGKTDSSYVFDNNTNTVFVNPSFCVGVSLKWTYSNRREAITRYGLAAAPSNLNNHPSGWNLEASNNGVKWNMLNKQSEITFKANEQRYFDFYNEIPYSSYRLTVTQCKFATSNALYLADFYLFSKRLSVTCFSEGFPPSFEGEHSYTSCPDYSTGSRSMLCTSNGFTSEINTCFPDPPAQIAYPDHSLILVKDEAMEPFIPLIEAWAFVVKVIPSLPVGVLLDPLSGIISGKPTWAKSAAEYTFFVSNDAGKAQTVLTIEVKKRPKDDSKAVILLITEFIVAAMVIVTVVIIIRVIRSRRMLRTVSTRKELKRLERTSAEIEE